jgi:hypothetical protein
MTPGRPRPAAKVDAVVAALTPDKALALPLTADAVVLYGDFQRGLHRLGAGAGEHDAVEAGGEHVRDLGGEAEGGGDAVLERRGIVELLHLLGDGFADFAPAVAQGDAVQARGAVKEFFAACVIIIDTFGPLDEARLLQKLPVGGERHPLVNKRVVAGGKVVWHAGLLWIFSS